MADRYYYTTRVQNRPIRRRLDRRFITWVLLAACVGSVVASGFVYSARCHFEAVSLGYETQQQREALDQAEERRRQLEVERSRTSSPEAVEARARKIGLRKPEPAQASAAEPRRNAERTRVVTP